MSFKLLYEGYFPFCITPAVGLWSGSGDAVKNECGPGTNFPVKLSLDQVLRWYWRSRKWSSSGGVTTDTIPTSGPTSETPVLVDQTKLWTEGGDYFAEVEPKNLVCDKGLFGLSNYVLLNLFDTQLYLYMFGPGPGTPEPTQQSGRVLFYDGGYWPLIDFSESINEGDLRTFYADSSGSFTLGQSLIIDGVSIPLGYLNGDILTKSVDLELTISEEW